MPRWRCHRPIDRTVRLPRLWWMQSLTPLACIMGQASHCWRQWPDSQRHLGGMLVVSFRGRSPLADAPGRRCFASPPEPWTKQPGLRACHPFKQVYSVGFAPLIGLDSGTVYDGRPTAPRALLSCVVLSKPCCSLLLSSVVCSLPTGRCSWAVFIDRLPAFRFLSSFVVLCRPGADGRSRRHRWRDRRPHLTSAVRPGQWPP
jgi:hypothetical protein